MQSSVINATTPTLRIVSTDSVFPHETHDSQRAIPLIEKIRVSDVMINPPIVTAINDNQYVILDGANRCYTFRKLGYPHLLVQVVSYKTGEVKVGTWQHIASHWAIDDLLHHLKNLDNIELLDGHHKDSCVQITLNNGQLLALHTSATTLHEQNAVLRDVVDIYQTNATLFRTAITNPEDVWNLYPEAIAFLQFPEFTPQDIITATLEKAYLPPGISRHIIHGRALKVNYPMDALRDESVSLEEKNQALQQWVQQKLANRQVRYYAETTYQFDE